MQAPELYALLVGVGVFALEAAKYSFRVYRSRNGKRLVIEDDLQALRKEIDILHTEVIAKFADQFRDLEHAVSNLRNSVSKLEK